MLLLYYCYYYNYYLHYYFVIVFVVVVVTAAVFLQYKILLVTNIFITINFCEKTNNFFTRFDLMTVPCEYTKSHSYITSN